MDGGRQRQPPPRPARGATRLTALAHPPESDLRRRLRVGPRARKPGPAIHPGDAIILTRPGGPRLQETVYENRLHR